MKKHSYLQYASALYEITSTVEKNSLDSAIKAFVELLRRDRMFLRVDRIIKVFEIYSQEKQGTKHIGVRSVYPLSMEVTDQLKEVFGQKAQIDEQIDKKLIGGIIIQTKNEIFDASISTQLKRLKQSLYK